MPFAQAHDVAGAAVKFCEANGLELSDLTGEQLVAIDARLRPAVAEVLTAHGSVNARNQRGGTGAAAVAAQLEEVDSAADSFREWARS